MNTENDNKNELDNGTGVPIPTPVFYLIALIVGIIIDSFIPYSLISNNLGYFISVIFIIPSILIMPPILKRFKKVGTPFRVREAATALVTDGPYKYSRNPGYISLTLLYVGLGFALNSIWLFILLVPVLLLVDLWIIRAEEQSLEKIFGEQYKQYKSTVRRWI